MPANAAERRSHPDQEGTDGSCDGMLRHCNTRWQCHRMMMTWGQAPVYGTHNTYLTVLPARPGSEPRCRAALNHSWGFASSSIILRRAASDSRGNECTGRKSPKLNMSITVSRATEGTTTGNTAASMMVSHLCRCLEGCLSRPLRYLLQKQAG